MALFGGKEDLATLNILTRFYQVAPIPPDLRRKLDESDSSAEKLAERIEQWDQDQDEIRSTELYKFVAIEKNIDPTEPDTIPVTGGYDTFKYYLSLWELVHSVMDALADDLEVPATLIDELVRRVFERPDFGFIIPAHRVDDWLGPHMYWQDVSAATMGPDAKIRLRHGHFSVQDRGGEEPKESILSALYKLLSVIEIDFSRVQRCIECQNPYVFERSKQAYCSHRCANRAGSRRRRKEKSG